MAKSRDPKVRVASAYSGGRRVMRNPAHPFQLRSKPFQIQPFLCAPVLPGETLKNLVCMSRVVTKPLKNPLLGWWCEQYFFYVKLRDIEFHLQATEGEWLDELVTSPTTYDPAALRTGVDLPAYYAPSGSTPWAKYATETCIEYYFRDEGEDWDVAMHDGMPIAQIGSKNWMDSLTLDDNKRARDVPLDGPDADTVASVQEMLRQQEHWQALRDAGLESLDYEDWIRTFGVQVPERDDTSFSKYRPELLRYARSWQYPTNTVEPTTGVPSSAVSWVNAVRADKDRMFKEPGFIIGLQVVKPKVYLDDPTGGLSNFMETLENWLPALSHKEYEKGFIPFAANAGPLANKVGTGGLEAYWVDLRDLLVHGDQFLNFAPDATAGALSALGIDGKTRYPVSADIDALFTGADKYVQTDGVVNLSIAGRQMDKTPRGQYL